jgi:2-oxoglutarate ferredoxin oxidoreductase subunit alpha
MLIAGTDAIGSARWPRVKFYAAYPMTPSTGIMNYMADKAKERHRGGTGEDEIAAINMALGASFAGVRSMTGTSGGGVQPHGRGLSLRP